MDIDHKFLSIIATCCKFYECQFKESEMCTRAMSVPSRQVSCSLKCRKGSVNLAESVAVVHGMASYCWSVPVQCMMLHASSKILETCTCELSNYCLHVYTNFLKPQFSDHRHCHLHPGLILESQNYAFNRSNLTNIGIMDIQVSD